MWQGAAGDAERMRKREGVGIPRARECAERGLMHERADREVREQKAAGFLPHQLGRLAAEDALRAAQMRLEFVERRFHLPVRAGPDGARE